ncbi:MAG TPA: hypothetical protein VJ476_13785, partial [Rhizomicrobium sp.]|nr:hypothetical protein [Rhizomicrobium sp.]
MAEQDSARESRYGASTGVAFAAASADPALREELRDYLRRQSDLAAVQIEEAKREDAIRHWGL